MFYRKYRPQSVSEIDNEFIRKQVMAVLAKKDFPHAFLFAGPKGTGKTSTARIIAKAINCQKLCNQCEICVSITAGSNLDVLEIDAASNRGIDEIRDLREKIKFAPISCLFKVYIIDEVHMLTNEAFNALLKTLEEPPAHAVFILATTEPAKLPATIVSRCQRFNFRKAKKSELVCSLKRVVKGENLKAEDKVLEMIAEKADGSFRDASQILEQMAGFYGSLDQKKADDFFLKIYGSFEEKDFFEALIQRKTKEALLILRRALEKEGDPKVLAENILAKLHRLILGKYEIDEENFEDGENLKTLEISDLKRLILIFSQAAFEEKTAVVPGLPLELAIIEWSEEEKKEEVKNDGKISEERVTFGKWPEILKAIKPFNHSVEALLKSCRPKDFDGRILTISTFYKFHHEKLEEPKTMALLEKVAGDITGQEIKVKCVLEEKRSDKPVEDIAETAERIFGGE